jgi:hypothetical protein
LPSSPDISRAIVDLATELQAGERPAGAELKRSLDDLEVQDREQDITLKRMYAKGLFAALAVQLVAADALVYIYAASRRWDIPASVIEAWLAATVIELIGVVLVVTRYLFPRRPS